MSKVNLEKDLKKEIAEKLRKETLKWLKKLKQERKTLTIRNNKINLNNIDAYIEDCEHFLKEEILIEAFEAVIYAYGLLDMLKALDYVQIKSSR